MATGSFDFLSFVSIVIGIVLVFLLQFSAQRLVRLTRVFVIVTYFVIIMDPSFEMTIVNDNKNQRNTNGVRQMSVVQLGQLAIGQR